ncbi:MAG: hypothetical protein M3N51_07620 [Actinomycetota bacterium]|nr:hypothetical protein [Actinomycetota bacterium]
MLGQRMDGIEDRMSGFEGRMDRFEDRMGRFEEHLHGFQKALTDQTRTLPLATVGSMTALTAIYAGIVTVIWQVSA